MKIINFRGDLTDNSAKKEALVDNLSGLARHEAIVPSYNEPRVREPSLIPQQYKKRSIMYAYAGGDIPASTTGQECTSPSVPRATMGCIQETFHEYHSN